MPRPSAAAAAELLKPWRPFRLPRRLAPELRPTLSLLAWIWLILAPGAGLAEYLLGAERARLLCFGACAGIALGHRWRRPLARGGRSFYATTGHVLAGLLAGLALLPTIAGAVANAGQGLGLSPLPVASASPGASGPETLLATLALAPIFEEIVYRERLLGCLVGRIGALAALLVADLAFALPHASSWSLLGSASAGIVLGAIRLASHSTPLCMGVHAGMNLGLEIAFSGPVGPPPIPLLGWLSGGALLLGIALLEERRLEGSPP